MNSALAFAFLFGSIATPVSADEDFNSKRIS